MARPNVNARVREVGWLFGNTNGSLVNVGAGGQSHGFAGALGAGGTIVTTAIQTTHAIFGGASVFAKGDLSIPVPVPSRAISLVKDTHCVYVTLTAHLRSDANVSLPGRINLYTNDLWPDAASVPAPTRLDLGDWRTNQWQEWEEWSPLTVPTAPPGFHTGGDLGLRYEYRRYLGRVQSNFLWVQLTNLGSVAAAEYGIGVWLSSSPAEVL